MRRGTESKDEAGNARDVEHGERRENGARRRPPRPDPISRKKNEAREENPNIRQDESERAQARERHEQRTEASKPPSRPQPQTARSFAHPTPGGGGLIEARKQERTRMRGKGEREKNHPSRRHGMTKSPTQSARWNPNQGKQAAERKKYRPVHLHEERGDIKIRRSELR